MNEMNLLKVLDTKVHDIFLQDLNSLNAENLFEILSNFLSNESELFTNIRNEYLDDTGFIHLSDLVVNYLGSNRISTLLYEYVINNYNIIWCVEEDEDSDMQTLTIEGKQEQMLEKCKVLTLLNWGCIYQHVILSGISNIIDHKVETICKDVYDELFLASLYDWIDTDIKYYIGTYFSEDIDSPTVQGLTMVCCNHVNKSLYKCRSNEMFDIITEYPDSKPCLGELKDILNGHTNKYHSLKANSAWGTIPHTCSHIPSTAITNGSGSYSFKELGYCLRNTMKRRLLHPGASTVQILDLYITMIKTLRELDPLDILLNYVTVHIRSYLKQRNDTIRCIVSSLVHAYSMGLTSTTDANGGLDLYAELKKGGASLESNTYTDNSDNEEGGPGISWEPRKRDKSLQNRLYSNNLAYGMDVIALLVSIYGSTDVFVSEYRYLLNTRLVYHDLSSQDADVNALYDIDREIANLELLKIRFGDEPLHDCEVMLHDVENSKRVNTAITSEIQRTITEVDSESMDVDNIDPGLANVMDCMLVSDAYWPCIHDIYNSHEYEMQSIPKTDEVILNNTLTEIIHYHPIARGILQKYHATYRVLKNPRRLLFFDDSMVDLSDDASNGNTTNSSNNLGFVELELDFEDGTSRQFTVPPVQASIILHIADMSDKASVSLSDLAELLEYGGCSETEMHSVKKQIRSRLGYWTRMGVLQECFLPIDVSSGGAMSADSTCGNGPMSSPFAALRHPSTYPSPSKQYLDLNSNQECYYRIVENQFEHASALGYESVTEYHNAIASSHSNFHTDSIKSDSDDGMLGKSESNSKQMLETCEQFIHGLLVNHKTMTLERLFSMLKMLSEASDGASNNQSTVFVFDMTQVQLRNHMSLMVERELVEYFDGTYSLPKQ